MTILETPFEDLKVGMRVRSQITRWFGTIIHISGSDDRITIEWDDGMLFTQRHQWLNTVDVLG